MRASETEIIIEHALLNESNMVLAAKIGAAYKQLQERVILRFLERLRDELGSTFGPEWSVELELNEKDSPYLYAKRPSWPEEVSLGIASDNGCVSWVYIYVTKCGAKLGNALLDGELEAALTEAFGRSKSYEVVYLYHPEKFRHWGEEETLVEIYRASEALEYMKALLMRARAAIAPIIDGNLTAE